MPQKVPQEDSDLRPGQMGEVWIFELYQNYLPLGVNFEKVFQGCNRVQGEVHAKFGRDHSSSLASKSKQTDRQTNRHTSFIYIDVFLNTFV